MCFGFCRGILMELWSFRYRSCRLAFWNEGISLRGIFEVFCEMRSCGLGGGKARVALGRGIGCYPFTVLISGVSRG